MWKIGADGRPIKVKETKLPKEKLLEENLEDWIARDSSLLGEPLLIVGRQVIIPDVRDRLDLLALDPDGRAVIIELKRGKLKDPVDMQALRYASYISKWGFDEFESHARTFFNKEADPEFNFNELYENFCSEAGADETPEVNTDQRMIVVGSEVKEKLGSVALWLREHHIDIKVIEVDAYREGESLFLQPRVIIPVEVSRFTETGRPVKGDVSRPWLTDGRTWHLEKRCSPKTKEMLLQLDSIIQENLNVDGPRWNQGGYVAYRIGNRNWLYINTHASVLSLDILVKIDAFKQSELAKRLGVEEFDKEQSHFDLPSSVYIEKRSERADRVTLRIKEEFDLESEAFLEFLKEAYEAFPFAKE
ncbi:hypothetical protein KAX21_06060 [candidate division WOR-3 bacterium]|nr:hypothetical protein [candidate division WOR-3 bacterium]